MKKFIFSAMVAYVAIGGAFASNSNPKTLFLSGPNGTPNASCTIKDLNCQRTTASPACIFNGIQQFASNGTDCVIRLERLN